MAQYRVKNTVEVEIRVEAYSAGEKQPYVFNRGNDSHE